MSDAQPKRCDLSQHRAWGVGWCTERQFGALIDELTDFTAKRDRLSDNLKIRTRELEDRTAERDEITRSLNDRIEWLEAALDARIQELDKAVAALDLIKQWCVDRSGPNRERKYNRCVVCDCTWWGEVKNSTPELPRHERWCWVPSLSEIREGERDE